MKRLEEIPIWLVGLALIAIGASVIHWNHYQLVKDLGDALVVAGILALVVDPYLKHRLVKEASRGIFIHLLGFEHHPQVKDKLKKLVFETKLLRKRFDLRCKIIPLDVDGYELRVETDAEITNPTHTPEPFIPNLGFEMAERPVIDEYSFTPSSGKGWTINNPAMKELPDDLGVQAPTLKKCVIEPEEKGITYRFCGAYRLRLKCGLTQIYMGLPTLEMTIRVEAPPDYEVFANNSDNQNENFWQYNTIRMQGDHVILRWRQKGKEWA